MVPRSICPGIFLDSTICRLISESRTFNEAILALLSINKSSVPLKVFIPFCLVFQDLKSAFQFMRKSTRKTYTEFKRQRNSQDNMEKFWQKWSGKGRFPLSSCTKRIISQRTLFKTEFEFQTILVEPCGTQELKVFFFQRKQKPQIKIIRPEWSGLKKCQYLELSLVENTHGKDSAPTCSQVSEDAAWQKSK